MIIIGVSLVLVIFLSNQDGNHDGYITFIQRGNNFNNQNDKRGNNNIQSGSSNFLSNQDGNHDGYTTFNQSGNNQNDKRGTVMNTTFNQNDTVMNQQNDKRGTVMNTTVMNNQNDKRGTVMNTT